MKGDNFMLPALLLTAIVLFGIGFVFFICAFILKNSEKKFFSECKQTKGVIVNYSSSGNGHGSNPVVEFLDDNVKVKSIATVENIFAPNIKKGTEVDILYIKSSNPVFSAYRIKILSNANKPLHAVTILANVFLAIAMALIITSIILCIKNFM